ncbi:hypothetical protein [Geodermatophilus sp. SYSU D00710]
MSTTRTPAPGWPAPQAWPPPPPWPVRPRRTRARRVLALVLGVLLLLPGVALLVGGGALVWAHGQERSDGFVSSPEEAFTSTGHALVSDRIDLAAGPRWLPLPETLGTARVEVTGTGSRDVFVGIATAADAAAYLGDVRRTHVDGLGFGGPADGDDDLPGGEPPGPPTAQDFWIAEATGRDGVEVTWDPADGDWVFVVMNADGGPGVYVDARIGVEAPALGGIGWASLGAGALLTTVAVVLVRPRRRPAG